MEHLPKQKKVHGTWADLAKYVNKCKCHIWGDICIDRGKSQVKSKMVNIKMKI